MNRILIVAAHPDDECLGSAGTIARMIMDGAEARTLFLGYGRDRNAEESFAFVSQIRKAGKILGIQGEDWIANCPPDNQFDSVPLLSIVKEIEKAIEWYQPNTIFTHYERDLNIDHQIAYRAVVTATRPILGQTVREIYSFEIPSSTEWAFPLSFSPDVFWDIDETLDQKIAALDCYREELRLYPHPRSIDGIEYLAGYRGLQCGCEYAEAFKTVRVIR